MKSKLSLVAVAGLVALSPIVAAPAAERGGGPEIVAQSPGPARPMAIFVAGKGVERPFGTASGFADTEAKVPLTVVTPLRIASNTKTFVAAAALRLWEEKRLDLDSPIAPLLSPRLEEMLRADGYETGRITVRQLMSHSAGLYDHGGDPRFTKAILADPAHVWTREELVRLSMDYADPQSAPGTQFRYSDTGYILLGDIVERITGESVGAAVRRLLRLDRLGLASSWWEVMEPTPVGAPQRARQWIGDVDATDVHASMDLFGGGGLVMSARDLAIFTAALFEGRIFDRPETIREMLWKGPHRGADQYRLGIFVKRVGDRDFYWHSGFWGTVTYYVPDRQIAVSGVTTHQQDFPALVARVEGTIGAAP